MTVHEVIASGWKPPRDYERILSLTQVRDTVVVVTDHGIYRAEWEYGGNMRVVLLA